MALLISTVIAAILPMQLQPRIHYDETVIDRIIQTSLKQWNVPGIVVVIVHRNQVIHQQAYGFAEVGDKPIPMRIDHAFPIASCSKAFTSALMAKLVDEQAIQWNDKVSQHLPDFHISEAHADALINMEDLFTHRSGFGGTDYDLLWYHSPLTNEQLISRLQYLPASSPFRVDYQYSSLMFLAAGEAMANHCDKSWEELILTKLCNPIGMKQTFCDPAKLPKTLQFPQGYHQKPDGRLHLMKLYQSPEPNPSGSIHTTAHDLALWMRFQLNQGTINGTRIVSAKNLQRTKTAQTIMPKDDEIAPIYPISNRVCYAMGWVDYDYHNEQVIAHGGVSDGFRTQITLLPKYQLGIALMNNLHKTKMNIALTNKLIDQLIGAKPRDWDHYYQQVQIKADRNHVALQKMIDQHRTISPDKPIPFAELMVGEYQSAAYGKANILSNDDGLTLQWNGWTVKLQAYSNHRVIITAPDTPLDHGIISLRAGRNRYDALFFLGLPFYREGAKP